MTKLTSVVFLAQAVVTAMAWAAEPVRVEAESFQPVADAPAWVVSTSLRDPDATCPGGLSGGAALHSNDPAARMECRVELPPTPHAVWVRRFADSRYPRAYPLTVEINGRARVINDTEAAGPGYVWEWWGRVPGGVQQVVLRDPGAWSVAVDCLLFAPDALAGPEPSPLLLGATALKTTPDGQTTLQTALEASPDSASIGLYSLTVSLDSDTLALTLPLPTPSGSLSTGQKWHSPPLTLNTTHLPRGHHAITVIARADDPTRTPVAAAAGSLGAAGRAGVTPCQAEVRQHLGRPVLFVNGRPYFALAFIGPRLADVARMGSYGVRFMNLGGGLPRRRDDGAWDFSATDEAFLRLLCTEPRAYYFPRVFAGTPANLPDDERVKWLDANGEVTSGSQPSLASEMWLRESEAAFRALARHIVRGPYADRVIGLHLCAGDVGEWFQWSQGGRRVDVSPAMRRAFARWLRDRYRTEARLRTAWGDAAASLQNPRLPTVHQLWASDRGGFREPRRHAATTDFMRCYNDVVTTALERFARAVKQGSDGRLMTGAFYGYTFGLHHWVAQTSGHLGTGKALRSRNLDFITSPCGYGDRGVGGVSIYCQGVWASQALHGKIFYGEADIRTHLCRPDSVEAYYRSADTPAQSVALLQREFVNCLTGGNTLWWYDMDGGWFDEPRILHAIRRMSRAGEDSLQREYRSRAEIAVIVDPKSWLHKAPVPEFDKGLGHHAIEALARLGAPWDAYLLQDLGDPRVPDYKLYLFTNTFDLTAAERAMVARKVKRGGATAVWVYAPGFLDETRADLGLCQELTGFRLGYEGRLDTVLVDVGDRQIGNPAPAAVAPLWYAEDPEAEVLGRLRANGKPGLVRRRFPDWVSVYSSAPLTDPAVLRDLARTAGVHIYSESGDAFYLDNRYFGIHVGAAGPRRIRFPEPVTVRDLWSGKVLAEHTVEFVADLREYGTGVYEYDVDAP
ncbi:MAG: hypothetical protein HPY69_19950 [Armatimonadetes bacterium]|nr:hypothetical protein [Armatimonadota bacterium]